MWAPLVSFHYSKPDRPFHSQPLDFRSTAVIHWADRNLNSSSISAVQSRSTAGILFCRVVRAVERHREPSISHLTVHSHRAHPARVFKSRRARFNVDRWIQDPRPTLASLRGRGRADLPWSWAVGFKIKGPGVSTSFISLDFPVGFIYELEKGINFENA